MKFRYSLLSLVAMDVALGAWLAGCSPSPQVIYQPAPQVVAQQPQAQYVEQPLPPQVIVAQPAYNNGYMDFAAGAVLTATAVALLSPNQFYYSGGQYYARTSIHYHTDYATYNRIAASQRTQQQTINAQRQAMAAQRQTIRAQQQTIAAHQAAAAAAAPKPIVPQKAAYVAPPSQPVVARSGGINLSKTSNSGGNARAAFSGGTRAANRR